MSEAPRRTPLYDNHVGLGARMVSFAGYDMPVQYPTGILTEHNWTRTQAGLFDVSHMGQCFIAGPDFETAARAMEQLVPADILGLAPGQQRYTQLLGENGGILDDLMVTREAGEDPGRRLYVVVNAARKEHDFVHIAERLPHGVALTRRDDLALVALQGPAAEDALAQHLPGVRDLAFMHAAPYLLGAIKLHVSRSGYTGEDGFEISVGNSDVARLWQVLLSDQRVKPIGLGARDSLRLEAGLCLYGHDMDETTSPVEANLLWSISKRRRSDGGFTGATRVQNEIMGGPSRLRIGIKPEGKLPAREGSVIQNVAGRAIGKVTSGGFGPTVNGPVAMGYVDKAHAAPGTPLYLIVRDKAIAATVCKLPFVPNRFKR